MQSVKEDYYTTNYFSDYSVSKIEQRNTSKPFWLHLTYQAVHTGAGREPPSWERWGGDKDYLSATYVLDNGIGNITAAFKAAGMWDNMLFMVTADNGGDCGLPPQTDPKAGGAPGFASNWPVRKPSLATKNLLEDTDGLASKGGDAIHQWHLAAVALCFC